MLFQQFLCEFNIHTFLKFYLEMVIWMEQASM